MEKIPLLKDNHNHIFAYTSLIDALDLSKYSNKKNALSDLSNLNDNKVNIARGWFDNKIYFTKNELESLPPIIICNNSLHKYLLNDKSKAIISKVFKEWVDNNDNQLWVEKNIMNIFAYIADLSSFSEDSLIEALNENLKLGVYASSDMHVRSREIICYLQTSKFKDRISIFTDTAVFEVLTDSEKSVCEGVKIFLDGALGAYSAALEQGYKNNKGNGLLSYTNSELTSRLEKDFSLNTGIAIHCIGDIAIEQALQTIKPFRKTYPNTKIRFEHAQFISKRQARLAKDLNIVLCMQPNFNMDSMIYSDRLNQYYCDNNNPFRMLIDDIGFIPGKDLIFGSDGMPTGADEALKQSLFPANENQKISLEEFIAAYCMKDFSTGFYLVDL